MHNYVQSHSVFFLFLVLFYECYVHLCTNQLGFCCKNIKVYIYRGRERERFGARKLPNVIAMGKHLALSLEVTCIFRLYLKIGRTSVQPSWKHWIFTSNYRHLHTWVPYITAYGWNRNTCQGTMLTVYL